MESNCFKMVHQLFVDHREYVIVYLNGEASTMKGINCVVPQASILSHLLVLMYNNDLWPMCRHTTPILFTNNTNLFCSGPDIKTSESNIENELPQISL